MSADRSGATVPPVHPSTDDPSGDSFDVLGPLPTGTTVLEASAGTGKTFTIAALAARYVVEEGIELGAVMMVTFGRNATDELRLRVRERLARTEVELAATLAEGRPPAECDEVGRWLSTAGPDMLVERHRRARRALADFDAATIATTHEFCLRMLDGLGVLGDAEPDAVFTDRLGDLAGEVARDVFLRRYAVGADAPLPYAEADRLARVVVDAAGTDLVPAPGEGDAAARRAAYADEVRAEVEARKARSRLFSYDDMLTQLRDALADPTRGPTAADRLRERYRVVLVDEFQDTDPIQWEILRRAFAGHTALVLIGDPKQAIYAFRGADVRSYLDARRTADRVATLDVNWRSDAALVEALDGLLGGARLGHDAIEVRPVGSAHPDRRLTGAGSLAPVRLRVVAADPDAELPRVAPARACVEDDLVADVTRLLAAAPRLDLGGGQRVKGVKRVEGVEEGDRDLRPSDVAVLVRTNRRGQAVVDALSRAGVPAVLLGSASVFASPAAADWLTLLEALEQPRQLRTRSAALTCFFAWTVDDLATADDDRLTELAQRIRFWSRTLTERGVAALLEVATTDERLPERLLGQTNGERLLTDLRHVAHTLHAAMTSRRLGVAALVAWLRERIDEAAVDGWDEANRRLETDADAVKVLTVHRSKGLEFPVVYLPETWDRFTGDDRGDVLRLHEPTGRRVLDVGGLGGAGRADRRAAEAVEDAGEDLRLLYVALTRAQCQVVTWWAATGRNTAASALHRVLSWSGIGELATTYPVEAQPTLRTGPGVQIELVAPRDPVDPVLRRAPADDLTVRTFDRTLDLEWRRTSYSALTRALHEAPQPVAGVSSESEARVDDEAGELAAPELAAPPLAASATVQVPGGELPSPMRDLPGGTEFGTLAHAVFEAVDPQADDLRASLRSAAADALSRSAPGTVTADALAEAMEPSFLTSLGPLAGDRRLVDIARTDRLAELDFELPLAGGDTTSVGLRLGDLVPVLRRHLGPADVLSAYADQLDHPLLHEQPLRGFLTGSVDAVLRVRDAAGSPGYLVVDYKTNWLGTDDGPVLRVADYAPDRMAEAMQHAHYPLQALLYQVALHRMLRWRQPGYDPEVQLAGVLYLFVRGMAGPETPTRDGVPYGVFSWRPPPALSVELSDLLDRGPR